MRDTFPTKGAILDKFDLLSIGLLVFRRAIIVPFALGTRQGNAESIFFFRHCRSSLLRDKKLAVFRQLFPLYQLLFICQGKEVDGIFADIQRYFQYINLFLHQSTNIPILFS